jgi:hypothetical protein
VTRIDTKPPYTLYGDDNNVANPRFGYGKPENTGLQTLTACPYKDSQCTIGQGTCLSKQVKVQDSYLPNFILFDAAEEDGWIDYVYDGGTMCRPTSGKVNMVVLEGCYTSKVDFKLTGGNRYDTHTDSNFPFYLYGDSCDARCLTHPVVYGGDGFNLDTWYTVTATPDGNHARDVVRTFRFDRDCNSSATCKSFPGYVFWPGYDSAGNDIGRNQETLESMIESCTGDSRCKGLTTTGYLKSYIKPARLWNPWYPNPGSCDGLYIKKPSTTDFWVNDLPLNDREITRLKWIAQWTVPNFAMSRRDAIADYVSKGALWSLTEEVLLLQDNPWDYNNCSRDQIGPLVTCPYPDWRVGIAAVPVGQYTIPELEDRGIKAYTAHFGYQVTAEDVLARAALQAGYANSTVYNSIVKATGNLRKAWLLKAHLVGFYFVAKEIERDCLLSSPPQAYCWGRFTPAGYPQMIQSGVDDVSILLQSLIGASGNYTA